MPLPVRPPIQALPSYSLTSDLLGFLRCGLQYRYTRIGNLPSSHPVQLWFGQFIHAVLEESYRQMKEGEKPTPPWAQDELDEIMDRIDRRLAARNIRCWNKDSEVLGRSRATAAVNELGPLLFPLINQAEVRVRGARPLPDKVKKLISRDIERYEMLGVIDVVTEIELFKNPKLKGNQLLELVVEELPGMPPPEFEVIVDYKGMKRPDLGGKGTEFKEIYEWQVHTYAHLRGLLTSKPVIAGVLVYLNELVPTKTDFYALRRACKDETEGIILPEPGSKDEDILLNWKGATKEEAPPRLSLEYRLKRAIRVIPIDDASIQKALTNFDDTVGKIEVCMADEATTGKVISSWEKNSSHDPTCEACDSKTYCPDHTGTNCPRVPGVRV
ncbi:MAG: PD-(D/E)XK nuclease family protein [Verrucomicrobiales bacterium]